MKHILQVTRNTFGPFLTVGRCSILKVYELKSPTSTIYLAKIDKLKITLKILLKKEAPIKKWELLRLVFQSVNKLQTKKGQMNMKEMSYLWICLKKKSVN